MKDLQKKPHHYIETGRNYRGTKGCLASCVWQLKYWMDTSKAGVFSLKNVGPKCNAGLPRIEHQNQEKNKNNIQLWKAAWCLFTRYLLAQWLETLRATRRMKCTKFPLQPHTLGSGRGGAGWTKATWGDYGFDGSGERGEISATRIAVLSHSPYCRSHLSWEEHTPSCGISLWESNSPTSEISLHIPVEHKQGCWRVAGGNFTD